MSLAVATNIAARENLAALIAELLHSLPGPIFYHVCDGQLSGQTINADEVEAIAHTIATCSMIYVLEGTRGRFEPIAGFIANESLGRAQLLHFIDTRPSSTPGKLPRSSAHRLGGYIRTMLSEHSWLHVVSVPGNVEPIDGLLGLKVQASATSTVTLAEAAHRPNSSRRIIS